MPATPKDQEVVARLQQMYGQALHCGYNAEGRVVCLYTFSSPTIETLGSRVRLTGFPQEICLLTALETLELKHYSFAHLPAEIGHLTHLRALWLMCNELEELPPEIGQLTELDLLMLGGNRLRSLPTEIGRLAGLVTFGLSANQLMELPTEIGQFSRLNFLELEGNQLARLPAEIGQLSALCSLDLGGNRLMELPAEIGQLRHLMHLKLNSNRLTRLPTEIGQLHDLEYLALENNQLTELPAQINLIGELPAEQHHLLGITFEVEDYGGSQPLRVLYDEVLVDYGLFALVDRDGPPEGEDTAAWPFGEELPDWAQTKSNTVCLSSRNLFHHAWVRLEAWEREAPPVTGMWDETCEVSFTSTSGSMYLRTLEGEASRHMFTLGPAGREYHLRISRRERQEDTSVGWEEGGTARGVEQYLFQFWPA